MHEEMDLDSLTAELLAVTDQTMEPTMASLWLRPSAQAPWQETHRGLSPGPLTAVPVAMTRTRADSLTAAGWVGVPWSAAIPGQVSARTMPDGPSHLDPGALEAGDPVSLEGEATMADYHYVSTWQLQAPIEQVWAAITDLEHLPAWYAGVEEARELAPGTPRASAAGSAM